MNKILSALLLCLTVCVSASAATRTWKGNTGTNGTQWSVAANWVENAAPSATDDVIIPAGCQVYPVLTAPTTCGNIYFEVKLMSATELNSARIQGQHYLTYTKAFCDISVTANRYIRVTSPLQSTYTGDFFAEHQTLNKDAWTTSAPNYPFVDALYEGVEGQAYVAPTYDGNGVMTDPGVVNRAIRGTYYSFYSSDRDSLLPINSQVVHTVANQWGAPVNGLGTEILPATSFDVWVNNGATRSNSVIPVNGEVTFHFPVANSIYYYFDENGHWAKRRDPSRVDRSKAGRFAYGDNNEEKLAVTLTHTGNSMMYAVGNPAFAYMDVAEFINANQKSIAPYVYKYVQGNPGTRGKERIYYYDYDHTPHKLYLINTNYDNSTSSSTETLDNHQKANITGKTEITKNHREAYFNAAEGFRVIGGSVAFVCDEPDLVGVYNNATFRIADAVRSKYYNLNSDGTAGSRISKNNGGSDSDIPLLKAKETTFTYAISTTDDPAYVRLNNFLNRGSVLAKIVQTVPGKSGQLVIEDDQAIMAVFQGNLVKLNNAGNYEASTDAVWSTDYADYWDYTYEEDYDVENTGKTVKTYSSPSNYTNDETTTRTGFIEAYRTMKLHGLTDEDAWALSEDSYEVGCKFSSHQDTLPGIKAYRITNANTSNITLNYTIENGTVNISMPEGTKMFIESDAALLSETKPAFNTIMRTNGSSGNGVKGYLCESWFAYEGFASTKVNNNSSEDFIMPDMVGDYSTAPRCNLGNTDNEINCYDQYIYPHRNSSSWTPTYTQKIEINRVLGSNNTVMIKGLYPGDDEANVLGQIDATSAGNRTATAQYSAFTADNGYKVTVSGTPITIEFTGASTAWGADYRSIAANGTIKVSGANISKIVLSTKNSYKGTWSSANIGSVNDRTWTGNATDVTLTQTNSTAARVTSITVTYAGYDYKLIIPAGQLAQIATDADGNVDPANSHYFYAHGNQEDMVKTLTMTWTYDTQYGGLGYWRNTSPADNNACFETMVARQGIQPLKNYEYFDGLVYGQYRSGTMTINGKDYKDKNYFELYQTKKGDINKAPTPEIKPGQVGVLKLDYIPQLFVANPTLTTTNLVQAPRREAAVNNAPAFIKAVAGDMAANTMIIRSAAASNEFCRLEDAPLFDVDNSALAFGTLAGTQLVGVNAIASLDTLPLYLSTSATLSFANTASLGEDVMLYDAVLGTSVLIDEEAEYELEINAGEQAGRYFLVASAEAPSVATDIDNLASADWKAVAYCPAQGNLTVSCAEEVSYEVYAINGMLMGAAKAQSYTFSGLQSGTYVVRALRGAEMQSLKVIVY